jgi:hypothetical protein
MHVTFSDNQTMPQFQPTPGQKTGTMFWTFGLENKGKSSAYDFATDSSVRVMGGPPVPDNNFVGFGTPIRMPAGTKTIGTVHYPVVISQALFDDYMKTENGLALIIKVRYRDRVGHVHNESLCLVHHANNSLQILPGEICLKAK